MIRLRLLVSRAKPLVSVLFLSLEHLQMPREGEDIVPGPEVACHLTVTLPARKPKGGARNSEPPISDAYD